MPLIYSRPGHTEVTDNTPRSATAVQTAIDVRIHELFAKAISAGATEADIEAGIAAAEATVEAILKDRAGAAKADMEAAIVATAT